MRCKLTVTDLINLLLWAIALIVLVPITILTVECAVALLPLSKRQPPAEKRPRLAVVMPAHNEALGIRQTLAGILPQLKDNFSGNEGARLLVVADNCTDETASLAREMGATVLERHDLMRRGKGYALDFGLRFLEADPPDIVVMIDADCQVAPGTIDRIAQQAAATRRPIQAIYLMETPAHPSPTSAVSALAFLTKNWTRPLGLHHLGLPCLLTGTGMAFPWEMIANSPLASGNIVEDMQLGLDLAVMGHPPLLCPQANVLGRLPQSESAATSQRTRWEHGHLQTLTTQVPRLLREAFHQRRLDLLAIALDLMVPPLSLLVMLWLLALVVTTTAAALGMSHSPAQILLGAGFAMTGAIFSSWAKFGRDMIPARSLLTIPLYLFWKLPLYFKFLTQRQTTWIRTQRDQTPDI